MVAILSAVVSIFVFRFRSRAALELKLVVVQHQLRAVGLGFHPWTGNSSCSASTSARPRWGDGCRGGRKSPPRPGGSFLRNHLPDIAAIDMFVVTTASFRLLYGLIVLGLDRRRVILFEVTQNPTQDWLSRQKIARLGFLGATFASSWTSRSEAFRAGLRDLGYVQGENLHIESRWADEHYDQLPALAAELVRLKVDVLLTYGTPGAIAASLYLGLGFLVKLGRNELGRVFS